MKWPASIEVPDTGRKRRAARDHIGIELTSAMPRCSPAPTSKSWAYARGVALRFIRPGKPIENAYVESFNEKFRDELADNNHTHAADGDDCASGQNDRNGCVYAESGDDFIWCEADVAEY